MNQNRIINISECLSIGLHAMVYLASIYDTPKTAKEIAQVIKASEAHLAKALQILQKGGLIKSVRGPKGGYSLAKPPKEIFLIEIFELLNGPLPDSFCLYPEPICKGEKCILGSLIEEITKLIKTYLSKTTLEDVKECF